MPLLSWAMILISTLTYVTIAEPALPALLPAKVRVYTVHLQLLLCVDPDYSFEVLLWI